METVISTRGKRNFHSICLLCNVGVVSMCVDELGMVPVSLSMTRRSPSPHPRTGYKRLIAQARLFQHNEEERRVSCFMLTVSRLCGSFHVLEHHVLKIKLIL